MSPEDLETVRRGQGINNMCQRAERLGGTLAISRRSPKGMVQTLILPADKDEHV